MQNIFTNIKCSEIILSKANENWYIILYDLFSRLCYIATCGPFCKDATHINFRLKGFPVADFQHGDGYTESHSYYFDFFFIEIPINRQRLM